MKTSKIQKISVSLVNVATPLTIVEEIKNTKSI
jgi:hypothetical protein